MYSLACGVRGGAGRARAKKRERKEIERWGVYLVCRGGKTVKVEYFGESGLLENEPTVPAEQAHTTLRQ